MRSPRQRQNSLGSLRFIIAAGILVLTMMLMMAYGLRQLTEMKPNGQRAAAAPAATFDGDSAYAHVEKVVSIGPRESGTPGAERTRSYIVEELQRIGIDHIELPFAGKTPLGDREMANVMGIVKGTDEEVIALSNHYDTKYLPKIDFVGANDSGSTTGWMLEMARTLGPRRSGRTIWLIWFDGEEAFGEWSETDGLYGSREFVTHLRDTQQLDTLRALINLDMIGDCHLGITRDAGAPSWIVNTIWKSAAQLGYESHFLPENNTIQDDHIPFRLAGIPCANLIDFQYGTSAAEHQATWHQSADRIDRVCAKSLKAVGDVIYHALPAIEAYLDTQARQP